MIEIKIGATQLSAAPVKSLKVKREAKLPLTAWRASCEGEEHAED